MPTYSFRNIINGEIIQRVMSTDEYGDLPEEPEKWLRIYEEGGEIYHRALDVDIVSTRNQSPSGWPRSNPNLIAARRGFKTARLGTITRSSIRSSVASCSRAAR